MISCIKNGVKVNQFRSIYILKEQSTYKMLAVIGVITFANVR